MNIAFLFPLCAFLIGAMMAFQPLVNAGFSKHINSPIWVSFISFAVGAVVLFIAGLIVTGKFVEVQFDGIKWWMLTSGVLASCYVTLALIMVPYIGVATLAALSTCGGLMMAAILDHYGILSSTPNPINTQKFLGLMLLGVAAIITLKA